MYLPHTWIAGANSSHRECRAFRGSLAVRRSSRKLKAATLSHAVVGFLQRRGRARGEETQDPLRQTFIRLDMYCIA